MTRTLLVACLGVMLGWPKCLGQTIADQGKSPAALSGSPSEGFLGPLVVDVPAGASRATVDAAVLAALRWGKPTAATADATYRFLVRHRLLRPGSRLTFCRPVVLREAGRLRLPDWEAVHRSRRRLGGGEIQFVYEGWPTEQGQMVSQFVQAMYPVAKEVYGHPSANITVRIVRDPTLTDATMHLRNGFYNASTNEIRFNPTDNLQDDLYTLTHLILYAFHDDALFAYDAWEEGFTWAATYVIFKRLVPEYDLGESFKTFYFMQFYELLNQPGIGNTRFWPASFDQMVSADRSAVFPFTLFVFRCGMAAAAWTKVFVENNAFFRDFNTAYYNRYTPGLAGNVPVLKTMAAALVPTVEGRDFYDWYRRQHILDSAIAEGRQLWVWALPQFNRDDNAGAHLALLVYHFTRDASGNEVPLAGTASLAYWSWDFAIDYFAEEGYQVAIPELGKNDAGVGAISPGIFNVGGAQKINVRVALNGIVRTVPWPYLVRGTEADPRDFFGVTLDSESGEVGVIAGAGQERKTTLSQGAFGLNAGMDGWKKTSVRLTDESGRTVIWQVNTGYDAYAAILQGPRPEATTFAQELQAGTHLFSVPAYPAVGDAEALNVPANRLLLAHWDPTLHSGDPEYRYRTYPGTPPLAPGVGFWLVLTQPTTVRFQGHPLPQDQSCFIPLRTGWNQIGTPFLKEVPVSSLRVTTDPSDPEKAVDWETAVNQGWITGTLWGYREGEGFVPATQMEPWKGYWIRAQTDVILVVPAVASPGQNPTGALLLADPLVGDVRSRRRGSTGAFSSDDWRLQLIARVGRIGGSVILGASRAATDGFDPRFDAERPPDIGDYVRLGVRHPEWGRAAGTYAMDIRAAGAHTVWDIELETNCLQQDVHISWPNLGRVPRNLRLYLTDLDGGQRRYLRTTSSLVVNSGPTGRRRLRLEACVGGTGALAITNVRVLPTRAPGALNVQYDLSADALVSIQVLSPSGRRLREVTKSAPVQVGTNHAYWDGRDHLGVALPPGIYLVEITATTEEGQSVRAVCPVVRTR